MHARDATARTRALTWALVVGLYATLTAIYARPLFGAIGSALPNDVGDPGLLTWSLWWNARTTPLTEAWWNAPMFAPLPGAFALSETLLGLAPITTPLQWLGIPPVATYNITYMFSFVAAALAAHVLAWRLTGRHDAALVAGLAYGFNPYRAAQIPHLQVLASWWMPCALIFLHAYLRSGRRRALVAFGVCWMLNGLTNGYYLMYFAVLMGLWTCWFARSRRQWLDIGVATTVFSVPWLPLIAGYRRIQGALGLERGRGEIESFSADLSALWAASPNAWLPAHWTFAPRAEGELYPGLVILAVTVVAGALAWRAHGTWTPRARRVLVISGGVAIGAATLVWITGGISGAVAGVPISVTRPHRLVGIGLWFLIAALASDARLSAGWRRRSVFLFYALAAVAMFALALGPVWRVFDARFMDKAPYLWLMQLPGGSALRVPARFGMLFVLCLSQAAALGFARLVSGGAAFRRVGLVGVLGLLILADGWIPSLPLARVPPAIDLSALDRSAMVLEVPTRDMWDDTPAMLRAMAHGRPVVNGFSGYFPPHYGPLQLGLRTFDGTPIAALRQFGPLIVVVNSTADGDGKWLEFIRLLPDAHREGDTAIGPAFSFAALPVPEPRASAASLRIVSIDATSGAADPGALVDDRLDTFWQTERALAEGDEVRVALERPALVDRIEIDLGTRAMEYPPLLRLSVSEGSQPPRVVWEGRVAGASMLGALKDRRRTTIAIDLPSAERADRVFLTAAAPNPEGYWAMAELRVVGRTPGTSEMR